LFLNKAKSKTAASIRYSKPSLQTLRNYADKTAAGLGCAVNLHLFLLYRDKPTSELPLWYRASKLESLPEITLPPKPLRKSPHPHMPALPPHLRQLQQHSE
jgi:hypothetical protein